MSVFLKEVEDASLKNVSYVNSLLAELTQNPCFFDLDKLEKIIASDSSHLFFLKSDDMLSEVLGMATFGVYSSPTGTKGWVEDVAVFSKYRGNGYGKAIVQNILLYAADIKVDNLYLTSRSSRKAANELYKKMGFIQKETNLYFFKISDKE